ncbi:MAG: hypothetical protein IPM42_04430 [Saprospiraceae bacterium]|nr:hypothetical protein [Saprospiraceae bacterium]
MTIRQKLEKLGTEKNEPCVTISMNTHRTHPDNARDEILLKNLLKEAEERVINEYGKRPVAALLEKMASLPPEIDVNFNLDSLHIYLSNDTKEIVKSPWPSNDDSVHISETFSIRPLIKMYNRSEEYLLMVLSQSGVQLYDVMNEGITSEIRNDDFPFSENRHYNTHSDKGSDPKHLDDLVREFLNKVDKAVVKVHNETGLDCVIICTEDNHSRLLQVADKPNIYIGYASIDYNNVAQHHLSSQSWAIIKELQHVRRSEAIGEVKDAVSSGRVITDLQEIYQAAIDGRGDLLIVLQDYSQPVLMTGERTFVISVESTGQDVIDDITSIIAWEVMSKKGRVIFTDQDDINELGNIVLKTRY